jgi:hypothetical protein
MKQTDISILIIGAGEHGKNSVCDYIKEKTGWSEGCSSYVSKVLIFEEMTKRGFHYPDSQTCWEDRRNHRALWKQLIREYNTPQLDRLIVQIFKDKEMYVGLRDKDEFLTGCVNGRFDIIVFVDAEERLGIADPDDCSIPKGVSDIIIDNNGTKEELLEQMESLVDFLQDVAMFKKSGQLRSSWADLMTKLKTNNLNQPKQVDYEAATEWIKEGIKNLPNSNKPNN